MTTTSSTRQILLGSSSKWRRSVLEATLSHHNDTFGTVSISQWSPNIDEKAVRAPTPEGLVIAVARAKLDAVIAQFGAGGAAAKEHSKKKEEATEGTNENKEDAASPSFEWYLVGDQVSVYVCKGDADPLVAGATEGRHSFVASSSSVVFGGTAFPTAASARCVILEKPETEEENRLFLRAYSGYYVTTVASQVLYHVPTGRVFEGIDANGVHFGPISESVVDELIGRGESMQCCGGFVVEDPALRACIVRIEGSSEGVQGLGPELLVRLLSESQQQK